MFVETVNRLAENVLYDLYTLESPTREVSFCSEIDEAARCILFQRQVGLYLFHPGISSIT